MKSIILLCSLFLLASCGKEQFGTAAQSESSNPIGVEKYTATFATKKTMIQPKVDILYVVDNSNSTLLMQTEIKNAIKKTIYSISADFDYRVIGIPLIETSEENKFTNFKVLTNSTEIPTGVTPISSIEEFGFFTSQASGSRERGLSRITDFMNHHKTSLFRSHAYHLVVIISNGRDQDVEIQEDGGYFPTTQLTAAFESSKLKFEGLKTSLNSQQLRLFSATASTNCKGWLSSEKSYQAMSKYLYSCATPKDPDGRCNPATDSPSQDVYDLCGNGLNNMYSGVNSSIKKVTIPHEYRYFPITIYTDTNKILDEDSIQVKKISNGEITLLKKTDDWTLISSLNEFQRDTREKPTIGEKESAKHFIRVKELIKYPDNIVISSTSLVEYFGYVVLPKPAKNNGIILRVNGQEIPKSAITYEGFKANTNIKVNHKTSSNIPGVNKTGYFIRITNPIYYYKSGDNVDVHYTPDAI